MATLTARVGAIRELELASPFDPRSGLIYAIFAVELLVGFALIVALGFRISPLFLRGIWFPPLLIVGGMLLRRINWPRFGTFMEIMGITYAQAVTAFVPLIPLVAISGPFADETLSGLDHALGLNWPAYVEFMRPAVWPLRVLYNSFNWQPWLVVIWLFVAGRGDRAWTFITASVVALAITTAVFPLFPAEGPFVYYGYTEYEGLAAPWRFVPILHALKEGVRHVDPSFAHGLIAFPSFHSVAGALFVWAMWPTRARYPVVLINLGLLMGTVLVGDHYFVDIIAGLVTGAIGVAIAKRVLVAPPK